ncbi:MAG: PD-(D/E)XK nuclease family transposase [Saprospiraceae bacterium]|nr:PD-(D/E)XK nuclease family transposase [Saprospiraceae bacterium]
MLHLEALSKEYYQQIECGEYYTKLNPVIFIGIFDFKFSRGNKYPSHYAVCDIENGSTRSKTLTFRRRLKTYSPPPPTDPPKAPFQGVFYNTC